MKPIKQFLISACIPLFVLTACSDSSDSNDENPVSNPAPVNQTPDVTPPTTPPDSEPEPETPQEPDSTPVTPINPDAESPSTDPVDVNDNDNNPTPTTGNPIANSQWYICSGGGPSVLNRYTFTATEYSFVYAIYDGSNCQGPASTYTEINGGTYTLGNTITTTDGLPAIELNMINTRLLNGELGDHAYEQYNIIHVNGDVMYLGYEPEYEEADRPQALHFDDEYRRYK